MDSGILMIQDSILWFSLLTLEFRILHVKETGTLDEVEDVQVLPTDIAVACLVNPLAGGMYSIASHKKKWSIKIKLTALLLFVALFVPGVGQTN
jgi:hypothetical protein